MKSLVSWICVLAASASYQAMASGDFNAYRLGNYNQAMEPLTGKKGNDPVANYYMGRMYLYGYGQLKNTNLALRYFQKSAEKGYLPAVQIMAKYSLMHENNPEQAVRWYKQAASAGDVNAQLFLAAAYLYGIGVKANSDTATHYFIDAAKSGNAVAQFALAENFIDSRHSGNNKLGLIWLTKSANNGNPKALTKLGGLYLTGKLVDKDEEKAQELFTQAVALNYTPAMVELGRLALTQGDNTQAIEWFKKAAKLQSTDAYLQLAHLYLQDNSTLHDSSAGFSWTEKAAHAGLPKAQKELATLYQKGIGVSASQDLADEWLKKADQMEQAKAQKPALAQAALWLSNGKTDKLEDTAYQMDGILSAWNNKSTWQDNHYNQAPQLELIARQELFKPKFKLTQPNDIPINSYFDALADKNYEFPDNQWTYPLYPLNPQMASLERVNSMVLAKQDLPAPFSDANYYGTEAEENSADIMDSWTKDWERQANYSSTFSHMYFRALLGDPQSQFEIGQMFQYGLGVTQNDQAAIAFYQNAAEQQHLGAEYNLGLLYLRTAKDANDYQMALNSLTDSAFKGNERAQYVLARLLDQGKTGPDGTEYIKVNHPQALSMLYLSASNGFDLAQYQLADYLAHEGTNGLSVEMKEQKLNLIRRLYAGAADSGVAQALLPLAYYNAMDSDSAKQHQAFSVAQDLASDGDEHASLLVGLLYDRGIGVGQDPAKAIFWYQQAGTNPVSQFILGTYTEEGKGVAENKEHGIELLQQSAQAQFPYADFNLAVLAHEEKNDFLPELIKAYKLGNNNAGIVLADYYLAEQDGGHDTLQQAKEIYTGLAEKGDQYAQLKLAYMFEQGLGMATDPAAAQRWYAASAEQGNAWAQYLLGQFYQVGTLGDPDYAAAKEWYKKAANELPQASVALGFIAETVDENYAQAFSAYEQAASKGDMFGSYDLGLMYQYGKGVPVDYQKAKALFTDAADKGSAEAMAQIAGMYFDGLGEPRNNQEALNWYTKAANLGNAQALYAVGLFFEKGFATKLDLQEALKNYQQASDKGNDQATLALARMYHDGLGVTQDKTRSIELYQQLAERQNPDAQYQLGTYYLEGSEGQRMPDKAKQLLQQASDNGNKKATQTLQRLQRLQANQRQVSRS